MEKHEVAELEWERKGERLKLRTNFAVSSRPAGLGQAGPVTHSPISPEPIFQASYHSELQSSELRSDLGSDRHGQAASSMGALGLGSSRTGLDAKSGVAGGSLGKDNKGASAPTNGLKSGAGYSDMGSLTAESVEMRSLTTKRLLLLL